jgi:hypothetical protein
LRQRRRADIGDWDGDTGGLVALLVGGDDAGYEPVSVGGIENVRALEDFVPNVLGKLGLVFYRFAPAGEL